METSLKAIIVSILELLSVKFTIDFIDQFIGLKILANSYIFSCLIVVIKHKNDMMGSIKVVGYRIGAVKYVS